jgi:phage terminase small subunit
VAKPRRGGRDLELTAREIRFCQHFLETRNATDSLKRAGYVSASDNAAGVKAWTLIRKPKVRDYLRELQAEAAAAAQVTLNRTVRELARIAFGNRGAAFDENGALLPPAKWSAEVDALIAGVETGELRDGKEVVGDVRKVKFASRIEAIKELNRVLGYVKDASQAPPANLPPLTVVEGESPP